MRRWGWLVFLTMSGCGEVPVGGDSCLYPQEPQCDGVDALFCSCSELNDVGDACLGESTWEVDPLCSCDGAGIVCS